MGHKLPCKHACRHVRAASRVVRACAVWRASVPQCWAGVLGPKSDGLSMPGTGPALAPIFGFSPDTKSVGVYKQIKKKHKGNEKNGTEKTQRK